MQKRFFQHTSSLIRFMFRRDLLRIPIWLVSLTFVTLIVAFAFTDLYKSDEDRQIMAQTMENPAMTAMVGPGYGLDDYTSGAMMAHQMLLFTALAVGIMSILLMTRHTRQDEEDGNLEMVLALPIGRFANLSAAISVLLITNVVLAVLIGFGLYFLHIESMDLNGSLLYGVSLGATGIFFTAITALFAQITDSSRGTISLAFTTLIFSYLIRAYGDVSNEVISWFSPLGWIIKSEVYVNNYWWPNLLTIGVALIIILLAFYFNLNRDLGAGLFQAKPGKKHASMFLQRPLGLALKLQKTSLISWAIGMFLLGASYGSVFGDLESFFNEIEMIQKLLNPVDGYTLTEQFIPMLMTVMSILCTVPILMSFLKLIGEERKNRTELILTSPIGRLEIISSYLFISIIISFVMQFLTISGLWLASNAVMDDGLSFMMLFKAAMAFLPAIWVMTGLAVVLVGILPKYTSIIWAYLIYSFFVIYLGEMLDLPEWLGKLSPFGYIPEVPIEDIDWGNMIGLIILAIICIIIGLIGYRKRDIFG